VPARFSSFLSIVPILILATGLFTGSNAQEQPGQKSKQPGAGAQPQANENPSLKVTTRIVLVDVVATNGKNEPVTDLAASDFTVFENGKPQQVSNFSLQQPAEREARASAASESPTAAPAAAFLPNVFSNVPRYRAASVWNVLLLDYMNSQVISQADLRQQLVKILSKLPDEPLAVYVLTDKLRLLQDFGTDRAALKQLILGLKNNISTNLDNAKGGHELERYPAGYLDSLPPALRESVIRMEAQTTAGRTDLRLRATVDALTKIVANVAALPGRKNLIWVSQSFPFAIEPGSIVTGYDSATGRQYAVRVPAAANALLDSQVAIYPIDPSGMHAPDDYDPGARADPLGRKETNIGPDSTITHLHTAETITHASVNELAERTGGRAFYNLNDVGSAIIESMHDGGTYYTLAYYPADKKWDGKFRRIAVKVNRSGVKLRYRTGYFALDPATLSGQSNPEREAAFSQAMEIDAPISTSLLFTGKVIPPSPPQNAVLFNFLVQPGALSTEEQSDGSQRVSVECAVKAFSEKGEPVNGAGNTMAGVLRPEAWEKISREGFPCRQTLELHPGRYLLRLGVRDTLSGRIGTVDASVTVPEPAQSN
jgi:VWFA-related protein